MSYMLKHYHSRKSKGLCVRCGEGAAVKRDGTLSSLCEAHLAENRSSKPWKIQSVDEAVPCATEPPRPAYQADYLKGLPPLPRQCPRCASMLLPSKLEVDLVYVDAVRCYACAWYSDSFMLKNKMAGVQS